MVTLRVRKRPDGYRYEVGDHRASDPLHLEPVLRGLGGQNTYEIHATRDVAWNAVVRAVDLLAALRYEHVQFHGTKAPAMQVRRAVPLPK